MEDKNYMVELFESTFMYIENPITALDISKLKINIAKNVGFDIYIAYSYDKQNYSDFRKQDFYTSNQQPIDVNNKLYLCIWFKRFINNDLSIPTHLYDKPATEDKYFGNYAKSKNVQLNTQQILVESIYYDNKLIESDNVTYKEYFQLIDEFPRWNFYDNQTINIQRWLNQCNSVCEMYGHTCIYFKTEPVKVTERNPQSGIHGTHYQLQNNVIRNVVDIKKLHIMCPNNELPQDRSVFTEWDMPLQDDFLIHIVRQKFEQAFGLKAIPNEKDYIYFPIVNKLFRVSTMQPKNGFMGVVGWYEVFLAKFESDDCVTIREDLRKAMSGIPEVVDGMESFDDSILDENDFLWDETQQIIDDGTLDEKRDTVEEQKEATQNYTNKLEDTTFYVSLKETEKLREFYDKRLNIVSVNPDDVLFPITMYDCSGIDKRTVALRYNMLDFSETNKFQNEIKQSYDLIFNFVLMGRFSGEIFDIIYGNYKNKSKPIDNVISTIAFKNKQLIMFDTATQTEAVCEYKFEESELYQIAINFDINIKQYSFKIFKLKNRQKTLEYQNIYNLTDILGFSMKKIFVTNLNLFGGKFLVNDVVFKIDGQKFIDDKCLPLLNMYKF